MNDFPKLLTPENFAMLVAIFLLVRFEKALKILADDINAGLKSIRESLASKLESVEKAVEKNTRLIALMIFNGRRVGTGIPYKPDDKDVQELICIPKKGENN